MNFAKIYLFAFYCDYEKKKFSSFWDKKRRMRRRIRRKRKMTKKATQ